MGRRYLSLLLLLLLRVLLLRVLLLHHAVVGAGCILVVQLQGSVSG